MRQWLRSLKYEVSHLAEDVKNRDWSEASFSWYRLRLDLTRPFRTFWYGCENLVAYAPVIWRDRNWDWTFMMELWEKKFRRMSEHERKYGHHTTSDGDAKHLLICAELCKRIRTDEYPPPEWIKDDWKREHEHAEAQIKTDIAYLTGMINKRLRHWWD